MPHPNQPPRRQNHNNNQQQNHQANRTQQYINQLMKGYRQAANGTDGEGNDDFRNWGNNFGTFTHEERADLRDFLEAAAAMGIGRNGLELLSSGTANFGLDMGGGSLDNSMHDYLAANPDAMRAYLQALRNDEIPHPNWSPGTGGNVAPQTATFQAVPELWNIYNQGLGDRNVFTPENNPFQEGGGTPYQWTIPNQVPPATTGPMPMQPIGHPGPPTTLPPTVPIPPKATLPGSPRVPRPVMPTPAANVGTPGTLNPVMPKPRRGYLNNLVNPRYFNG